MIKGIFSHICNVLFFHMKPVSALISLAGRTSEMSRAEGFFVDFLGSEAAASQVSLFNELVIDYRKNLGSWHLHQKP